MHRLLRLRFVLPFVLLSLAARPAAAQGGNVDIISGRVTDSLHKPLPGANIEVYSLETQVTRRTTSNDKGNYVIIFNDGGGQYRVTVRAIGYTPVILNVSRQSDDDRISLDVRLGAQATKLQDLVSNGARRPDPNAGDRPTAGENARTISGEQALRLPIDASDLAALAALAPGVITTNGTDSTAATFSVAGQSAESNSYVINGMTSANGTLPQDAVRTTRVITNTYDVSRGGFAGGQVSVTTKGGSNRVSGSFSSRLQDKNLAWGEATNNAFTAGQSREQVGGGFGGPLVRDKLFLFGSVQLNRALAPMASLDLAEPSTLSRLGAAPDSVNTFIALVNATGLTGRVGAVDPNRTSDQLQTIERFDWNIGQEHILTVTGNLSLNAQDPSRIGATQLPQVGGNTKGSGGGVSVQLASRMGRFVNQFRGGFSIDDSHSDPFLDVPAGRVTNHSTLDSGRVAVTTFGFGGNAGLPQRSRSETYEVTNELSVLPGRATHRIALGLYANAQHFEQDVTSNRLGTYTFNSLADFANNLPSQFTRTLQPTIRDGTVYNQAIYLSDAWRPRPATPQRGEGGGRDGAAGARAGRAAGGRLGGGAAGGEGGGAGGNFQLIYGLRFEHTSFGGAPELNQAVFDEFGVRTDRLPSETYLSPRIGFSYAIPAPEQQGQSQRGFAPPLVTIRGGLGIFRGTMPPSLPGTAQAQSGLSTAQTQLMCVGGAVPLPDWNAFANDPATIPTECVNGASSPILTGRPSVTTYADDYAAPKTKRVSLGLTRRLTPRITFNVDAAYVRGVGQSASRDLNLNATPYFALGGGDGRPVYADPSAIVAGTGVVPLSASRVDPLFGSVNQVFSKLENETKQITFSVTGTTASQMQLSLAYTLMRARDQGGSGAGGFGGGGGGAGRGGAGGGFGGGGNLTAGDPNAFDWAASSNERRHNVQASVSWPITPALELTSIARMTSGAHYTPIVAGDINGDGSSRNDRAYIFSPTGAPDSVTAAAMTRLLASTSGNAASCLRAQQGGIAARNSCTGPWQPALDLQLNWRSGLFDRRLAVSFQTLNLLGGLDELFNGADHLKGWGGNARPDATLLTVNGFDPATRQFRYVVNERFGNTSAGATAVRAPFQIAVNVRLALGYDQRTAQIQSLGQRPGAPRGQANARTLVDSFMVRYERDNPAKAALDRKAALVLSTAQVAQLTAAMDSSHRRLAPHLDSLTAEVEKVQLAGSSADVGPLLLRVRPIMAMAQREQATLRAAVRAILTEAQWALLPEEIRSPAPGAGFGPGGGRRPGGAGGGGRGTP